jgi:hypothetical protein
MNFSICPKGRTSAMTPTSPEEDSAQFYHPLSELLSEGQSFRPCQMGTFAV